MNLLIDIGHPAHVHLFRNFVKELNYKGNNLYVTVKEIPVAKKLLELYQIPYINLGSKNHSLQGKFINQFKYDRYVYHIVQKNRIDVGLGSSVTVAHVSKFTKMKSFIFDDDDSKMVKLFSLFAHPFCDYIVTPSVLAFEDHGKKHILHHSYHELAYLHPKRFSPDENILKEINCVPGEPYFVLRFVALRAYHDISAAGLSLARKKQIIDLLHQHGKVFITSEIEVEPEFQSYQIPLSPDKIHSLLYYATMFVGDGQTMTTESALLGTPAVKCNTFAGKLSVPNELEEKYDLCYSFQPYEFDKMMIKINELLKEKKLKEIWQSKRQKLLSEKIDLTSFMVWLIEFYPESIKILRENLGYQYNFR